ncbi:sugar ABC transporter permease [Microbacterium betulae]|uniref:Sugar ABC transporter permease n=1 Tax=Microbacterium betulae TaxID=2981139 RepID=A0AA97FHG8_9MICO|nr:sugar ABC transporter permease [Microbacterium sp. AB]WOF22385.1 sugar ABC transporter permease [Microbacterium sp. AB]
MSRVALAAAVPFVAPSVTDVRPRRRRQIRRAAPGLLFIAPAAVIVLVFVVAPIVSTVRLALHDWDGFSLERDFVGLVNFAALFGDAAFWAALVRNLLWIGVLLLAVGLGLAFALLLWSRPRGWVVFRTVYLIPEMIGPAIVGVVWLRLWQPVNGGFAGIGQALGIPWLASSPLADPALAIFVLLGVQLWIAVGFFVVVSLSGLQLVDTTLLDAALVDGASRSQRIRYVVLPQMREHIGLMRMLALIAGLKAFDLVWVMTSGGPGNATQLVGTYAYSQAFAQQKFGYGAALACVVLVIALVLTAISGRSGRER